MSVIAHNLQAVQERIAQAARAVSREPHEVALLAVSKTFGVDDVAAALAAGQSAFGENYLQEALDKMAALRKLRPDAIVAWHFIGPIQSNKTRPIAEHFDWVHSVDRVKIAQRLSDQRPAGHAAAERLRAGQRQQRSQQERRRHRRSCSSRARGGGDAAPAACAA